MRKSGFKVLACGVYVSLFDLKTGILSRVSMSYLLESTIRSRLTHLIPDIGPQLLDGLLAGPTGLSE